MPTFPQLSKRLENKYFLFIPIEPHGVQVPPKIVEALKAGKFYTYRRLCVKDEDRPIIKVCNWKKYGAQIDQWLDQFDIEQIEYLKTQYIVSICLGIPDDDKTKILEEITAKLKWLFDWNCDDEAHLKFNDQNAFVIKWIIVPEP